MNNPSSITKKDPSTRDSKIPGLIVQNTPANILKNARESLKNLSSQRPPSNHSIRRPLKVLPQASSGFDEIRSPKALPPFKDEPKNFSSPLQPNRAKSAYDTRGLIDFAIRSPGGTAQEPKTRNIFTADVGIRTSIDPLIGDMMENSGQKPLKSFIIKQKKARKGESPRKASLDLGSPTITISPSSAGQSPTNFRITHNLPKFSSFKIESKIKDVPLERSVIEEKKSESNEDTTRTLGTSGLGSSVISKFNISQVNSKGDVNDGKASELPGSGEITQSVVIHDNNSQLRNSQNNNQKI